MPVLLLLGSPATSLRFLVVADDSRRCSWCVRHPLHASSADRPVPSLAAPVPGRSAILRSGPASLPIAPLPPWRSAKNPDSSSSSVVYGAQSLVKRLTRAGHGPATRSSGRSSARCFLRKHPFMPVRSLGHPGRRASCPCASKHGTYVALVEAKRVAEMAKSFVGNVASCCRNFPTRGKAPRGGIRRRDGRRRTRDSRGRRSGSRRRGSPGCPRCAASGERAPA